MLGHHRSSQLIIGRAAGIDPARRRVANHERALTQGEECEMNTTEETSEPASELERLIANLSGQGRWSSSSATALLPRT
jgi:hypothetical protein